MSPLKAWLCEHAANSSLERFLKWQETGMEKPLIFSSETPMRTFIAYIDPENKFAVEDKLSQINTLEQCELNRSRFHFFLAQFFVFVFVMKMFGFN